MQYPKTLQTTAYAIDFGHPINSPADGGLPPTDRLLPADGPPYPPPATSQRRAPNQPVERSFPWAMPPNITSPAKKGRSPSVAPNPWREGRMLHRRSLVAQSV